MVVFGALLTTGLLALPRTVRRPSHDWSVGVGEHRAALVSETGPPERPELPGGVVALILRFAFGSGAWRMNVLSREMRKLLAAEVRAHATAPLRVTFSCYLIRYHIRVSTFS